jgi:hypothetical protein
LKRKENHYTLDVVTQNDIRQRLQKYDSVESEKRHEQANDSGVSIQTRQADEGTQV